MSNKFGSEHKAGDPTGDDFCSTCVRRGDGYHCPVVEHVVKARGWCANHTVSVSSAKCTAGKIVTQGSVNAGVSQ